MAITNLTGTKWTIETMNSVADYGVFELEGWVNNPDFPEKLIRLYIGWDMDEDGVPNLKVPNYFLVEVEGYNYWRPEYFIDGHHYIEITGGTAATNPLLISWLEDNGTLIPLIENKKNMYVGGNKVSKIMVGDKAAKKILIGDKVIYEVEPPEPAPSGYEVQITFQNAIHAAYWEGTEIYDDYDEFDNYIILGNKIGEITSVNGTTTVTTTTGKIGIKTIGAFTKLTNTPTTTGGVSYNTYRDGGAELNSFFDVSGNGTIVVDGVDYDN